MRYLCALIAFFLLSLFGYLILTSIIDSTVSYTNWQTESDIFITPKNTSFDAVFLGSSHGRIFSRDYNHKKVEAILDMKIINLSKSDAGIVPEKFFLDYFYERGNTTKTIVYFLDPYVFYSPQWNEEHRFLTDEPINFLALRLLFNTHVSADVWVYYIRPKLTFAWLFNKQQNIISTNGTVPSLSTKIFATRQSYLYPDGVSKENFTKYASEFIGIVDLAKEHHTNIVVVIPATLFPKLSGKDRVLALLKREGVAYIDLSAIAIPRQYFYNVDHLNTSGILYLTKNYLVPFLNNRK